MEIGKTESKNLERLGTYGVGMKLSSLTQAQEITIFSRPPGESEITLRRISKTLIEEAEELVLGKTPSPVNLIRQSVVEDLITEKGFNTVVTLERA